ncbi:MAG: 4Fe-4S dicluster domain-containing protein, partial [Eggerthellaceae bacterium]|nr:4Fe-4S dicluster domain-containing protein [Eggerthellaceae bacterium]
SFWERGAQVLTQINRETLIFAQKVCDPSGEAKEDLWIEAELAKRWGIDPSLVQPLSTKRMAFNELLGAEVILPDGSGWEPLVSVTDDDLKELGIEGAPHEGRIPLRKFLETGVYQVPRHEDDGLGHVAYADFAKDPAHFPVQSLSGKFEIYCSSLVERFKDFGLSVIAPIAKYVPARDGFETASGKYPLQCISVHVPSRSHQLFDNVAQLRELFPHDVWINPLDAKRSGITHGETVHVSSSYGQILRRAKVTRLVMPGVVIIGQGAWALINDKGIDEGGNANTLQGSKLTGEGHCTWNTSLVRVDPWAGEPLQLDYKRVSDSANQETRVSSSLKMHAFKQEKLLQDSFGQNGALRENQTTKVNNDHGSLGFFFNANECSGCKACVAACKDIHNLPVGKKFRKVVTFEAGEWQISLKAHAHSTELSFTSKSDNSGDLPSNSHSGCGAYADTTIENQSVFSFSLSSSCNHCEKPACLAACPRGAISKDPQTGIVFIDEDTCIGCGKCAKACPYDAPVVCKDLRKTFKCDLCKDRLQAGLEPACVAACTMRCLHVFPKNNLEGSVSEANRAVSENILPLLPSMRSEKHGACKQSCDSNYFVVPHRLADGFDKSQISLSSMIEEYKND